jgi:Spy/CpxP family protein refolding chaperone
MRKMFLGVVLGGALAWMGSAFAGSPPPDGATPDGGVVAARLAHTLGLDDATRAKLEAIVDRSVAQGVPIAAKVRDSAQRLQAQQDSATPDLKVMEAEVRQIADLRAEIAVLRLRTGHDIEALLTPDQVTRFRALRRDRVADRLRGVAERFDGAADPVGGL